MPRLINSFLVATVAIIASLSLLSWFGLWFDDPDIFSHLRLHYSVAAALVGAAAILYNKRLALVATLLVTLNFGGTVHSHAILEKPTGGPRLKVLTLNVMSIAQNSAAIVDLLAKEQPDVVFLQEVQPNRLGLLMQLKNEYPWQVHCAFETDCWVAVLSRHPMRQKGAGLLSESGAGLAWMSFGAELDHLSVATIHMPRPLTLGHHAHLATLATEVANLTGPVLIGGDFNATVWSGGMRQFMSRSGLRPAGDITPTWPMKTGLGTPCAVCFPQFQLDHVMVSADVRVLDRRTGPDTGSDHLPLIAEVELMSGRHSDAVVSQSDRAASTPRTP